MLLCHNGFSKNIYLIMARESSSPEIISPKRIISPETSRIHLLHDHSELDDALNFKSILENPSSFTYKRPITFHAVRLLAALAYLQFSKNGFGDPLTLEDINQQNLFQFSQTALDTCFGAIHGFATDNITQAIKINRPIHMLFSNNIHWAMVSIIPTEMRVDVWYANSYTHLVPRGRPSLKRSASETPRSKSASRCLTIGKELFLGLDDTRIRNRIDTTETFGSRQINESCGIFCGLTAATINYCHDTTPEALNPRNLDILSERWGLALQHLSPSLQGREYNAEILRAMFISGLDLNRHLLRAVSRSEIIELPSTPKPVGGRDFSKEAMSTEIPARGRASRRLAAEPSKELTAAAIGAAPLASNLTPLLAPEALTLNPIHHRSASDYSTPGKPRRLSFGDDPLRESPIHESSEVATVGAISKLITDIRSTSRSPSPKPRSRFDQSTAAVTIKEEPIVQITCLQRLLYKVLALFDSRFDLSRY